mmetsp:Transcript_12247/g.10551  ORF Transcript_12247/g.10551 Transcript_12247/m.10551 type:complete len:142 (+) Transcript_12247:399-824(+)
MFLLLLICIANVVLAFTMLRGPEKPTISAAVLDYATYSFLRGPMISIELTEEDECSTGEEIWISHFPGTRFGCVKQVRAELEDDFVDEDPPEERLLQEAAPNCVRIEETKLTTLHKWNGHRICVTRASSYSYQADGNCPSG